MDIPLYYDWDSYMKLIVGYYRLDAEKSPIKYSEAAEIVKIGENYVSSMSKWLASVSILIVGERGYYQLSPLGTRIAEKATHGMDFADDLKKVILSSRTLEPLLSLLKKTQKFTAKDLFTMIAYHAGVKDVKTHHKNGIQALIDALINSGILFTENDSLVSTLYSLDKPSKNDQEKPTIDQEKIAFLKRAIQAQGQSLSIPTEIEGVSIVTIPDEGDMLKPALEIAHPKLQCRYCLADKKDLDSLKMILNDSRLETILQYLTLVPRNDTEHDDVFRL